MMSRILVGVVSFVLVGAPGFAQQNQADIQRVLLEPTLWGADFALLLPQLQALRDSGETSAYVFADRAAGATAFATPQAAQGPETRMRARLAQPSRLRAPFLAGRGQAPPAPSGTLRVEVATLIEGDGSHLTLTRTPSLRFLPDGLTIQAVQARLGAPERVRQQTIHNRGERKPLILTLHIYAGGAIAFAESDAGDPGVVERVVLNLTSIVPVVAQ